MGGDKALVADAAAYHVDQAVPVNVGHAELATATVAAGRTKADAAQAAVAQLQYGTARGFALGIEFDPQQVGFAVCIEVAHRQAVAVAHASHASTVHGGPCRIARGLGRISQRNPYLVVVCLTEDQV